MLWLFRKSTFYCFCFHCIEDAACKTINCRISEQSRCQFFGLNGEVKEYILLKKNNLYKQVVNSQNACYFQKIRLDVWNTLPLLCNVKIMWGGHNSVTSNLRGRFCQFCSLLRIYELYNSIFIWKRCSWNKQPVVFTVRFACMEWMGLPKRSSTEHVYCFGRAPSLAAFSSNSICLASKVYIKN